MVHAAKAEPNCPPAKRASAGHKEPEPEPRQSVPMTPVAPKPASVLFGGHSGPSAVPEPGCSVPATPVAPKPAPVSPCGHSGLPPDQPRSPGLQQPQSPRTGSSYARMRSASTLVLGASPPIRSPAWKKGKFVFGAHSCKDLGTGPSQGLPEEGLSL